MADGCAKEAADDTDLCGSGQQRRVPPGILVSVPVQQADLLRRRRKQQRDRQRYLRERKRMNFIARLENSAALILPRVGPAEDLDASARDVDDPIIGDSGGSELACLLPSVIVKAAVRDLHDQQDI